MTATNFNLTTLIKRLEAATSRLEDLTVLQEDNLRQKSVSIEAKAQEIPDTPVTAVPVPIEDKSAVSSEAATVTSYQKFINEYVDPFVALSSSIDPLVNQQAQHFAAAVAAQLRFVTVASQAKRPVASGPITDSPAFVELFGETGQAAAAVSQVRDDNRASKFFNHLSTVSEGTPALGWVLMDKPASYVGEFKDSAQFYANKVLKEFKDSDKTQGEWAQQFLKVLTGLQAYVKAHFVEGLVWNEQGAAFEDIAKNKDAAAPAASAPPAPGPPPPPPLPPASIFEEKPAPAPAGGMTAVFDDLNRGESVTAGLRKVDKSEMTHKNPDLRKDKPVPPKKPASLSKAAPPTAAASTKSTAIARTELDGSKWFVENHTDNHKLVISTDMNQGVFIDKCVNCTIEIRGKASAVSVSQCSKIGLLVDSLVSGIDIIKSRSFGIQIKGKVSTVSVDQSTEGQIYLSMESIDCELVTAQTSSLNINIPRGDQGEQDGDYIEVALPEQLQHRVSADGTVNTVVLQHE